MLRRVFRHKIRHYDEKRVIAPRTLSKKTAVLIVCNFVPAPVLIMIHSLFSRLKYRGREAFL